MSSNSSLDDDYIVRFELPQGIGATEDVERYAPGGFHPVHLGDTFDQGRYRVVHKLGAGGFSTVWLARDETEKKWVALKMIDAKQSSTYTDDDDKSSPGQAMLRVGGTERVVVHHRRFYFDGYNGRHLCLVLPVLGPSLSELSFHFQYRLTPSFARRAAHQATRAIADLHAQGLCHGDFTTGNLLLGMVDLDCYEESDIIEFFGRPLTDGLKTQSGEMIGVEAPRYITLTSAFPPRVMKQHSSSRQKNEPFPSGWSKMVWNPAAIKVDGVYLGYYDDDWPLVLASLPKIPDHEAALLLDLLTSIFVYDPKKRPTAEELLEHPWFHLDGLE